MKRRFIAAILAAALVLGGSMSALAAETEEGAELAEPAGNEEAVSAETASETDENHSTWKLENGVLTISGSGTVKGSDSPLSYDERKEVISVIIEDGITELGWSFCSGCVNMKEVSIPESVTKIGYNAFAGCDSLEEVTIPKSVEKIASVAFGECEGLRVITFRGDAPEFDLEPGKQNGDRYRVPPFYGVTAVAYYPAGNETYTEEAKASLGGNLTWKEEGAKEDGALPPVSELPFTDVDKENGWYIDNVNYVLAKGIMKGMSDTEFGPSVNLARSHFATILYRMQEEPAVEYDASAFPDVAEKEFYTNAAIWAKSREIIKGYADGRFGAADMITREDMAVMMYRYAQMLELDVLEKAELNGFPDAGQVSDYAQEAVRWTVGKGIIRGKEEEGKEPVIDPQGYASRAQCAAIIQRFMEAYGL